MKRKGSIEISTLSLEVPPKEREAVQGEVATYVYLYSYIMHACAVVSFIPLECIPSYIHTLDSKQFEVSMHDYSFLKLTSSHRIYSYTS